MHSRFLVAVLFGFLSAWSPASADTIMPAGFGVGIQYYLDDQTALSNFIFVPAANGSEALNSGCVLATATRTACATAFSSVGALGTKSSMQDLSPDTIPAASESSNGFAWFRDVLTVQGLSGGTYTLVPEIRVEGTGSWDRVGFPQTVGIGIVEWGPDGASIIDNVFADATQSSYLNTFQLNGITFQAGVPFNFMIGFGEAARIYNGPSGSENSLVIADFLSTMRVTGLAVMDSGGQPVAQFSIYERPWRHLRARRSNHGSGTLIHCARAAQYSGHRG